MRNSTGWSRAIGMLAGAFLLGSVASAQAAPLPDLLCVGESAVVQAPPGWIFTYTPAKYALGWPAMADECAAAEAARAGLDVPGLRWEILPNVAAFDAMPDTTTPEAKQTAAYNPAAYMTLATSEPSRLVLRADSAMGGVVSLWLYHPETGQYAPYTLSAGVRHCGTTSVVPAVNAAVLCEGAARVIFDAPPQASTNPDAIYAFVGETSGLVAIGALGSGRAYLQSRWRDGRLHGQLLQVVPPGVAGCPEPPAQVRLTPNPEDPDLMNLTLCRSDWWMMPVHSPIASVTTSGPWVWVERAADTMGFALMGQMEGEATVVVEFDDPDAVPLVVHVVVQTCL